MALYASLTQALWQVRVARVEHRSARRAVDGWAGSTVVLRAGVEGGQKSRSQRALRAIGIHHQSRLRYARVEVADIAELVRVTRMVFPAEAIFQREARIDAKSILDKKRILHRQAGVVVFDGINRSVMREAEKEVSKRIACERS